MSSDEELINDPTNEPETKDQASDKQKEASGPMGRLAATEEKLCNIMEAASALTALGDEEEEGEKGGSKKNGRKEHKVEDDTEFDSKKRFIPQHKKPDAALTFPEKMMSMMKYVDKENPDDFCIAWLADGKSFVIRNPKEFTHDVLPKFFKATKFSSFIRKLYRWGFRQMNRGLGPEDPVIFGSEYFQRDNEPLIAKMRSVTARREQEQIFAEEAEKGEINDPRNKRRMNLEMELEEQRKRIFLGHVIARQQQNAIAFQQSFNPGSVLPPSMVGAMQSQAFNVMNGMGPAGFSPNSLNMFARAPALDRQGPPFESAVAAEVIEAAMDVLLRASR